MLAAMFTCMAAANVTVMTATAAAPRHVTGKSISDLVAGTLIELDTPLGARLPVTFAESGQMSAVSRDLARYLGSPSDSGRWWVSGDQLCHKWNRWFSGETQCLRLKVDGPTIHWRREDGTSGTATVVTRFAATAQKPAPVARPAPRPLAFAGASALGMSVAAKDEDQAGTSPREEPGVARAEPVPPPAASVAAPADGADAGRSDTAPVEAAAAAPGRPDQPPRKSAPIAKPLPAPEEKPAALIMSVVNVARWDVLNVRQGPTADHGIVGTIAPNSRDVLVTGPCRERWCPVKHQGVNGWVNGYFLAGDGGQGTGEPEPRSTGRSDRDRHRETMDSPEAPRSCLTGAARALLARIEGQFGTVRLVSTCRPGARIAGTGRISRHADGNAFDFDAGARKVAVIEWLITNHRNGGVMTYAGMDHIHVDIGRPFVSLAGSRRLARQ